MKMKTTKLASACMPLLLSMTAANAVPLPGGTLDPLSIPKYVTPLVIPPVMNHNGTPNEYDIGMRKFKQQILPGGLWNTLNGRADAFPATPVFGYGPAGDPRPNSRALGGAVNVAPAPNSQFNFPAYTVEATKDVKDTVFWENQMIRRPDRCGTVDEQVNDCKYVRHLFDIDQTLHWANPKARCDKGELRTDCHGQTQNPYGGPVPMIPHLHGAHVGSSGDGYTEAWWLPDASNVTCVPRDPLTYEVTALPGAGEYVCEGSLANQLPNKNGMIVHNINNTLDPNMGGQGIGKFGYPNDQPSSTLWFHDHTLGITRVGVYSGPAGFWLIRDPAGVSQETGLVAGNLPAPAPVAGEDLTTTNFPAAMGGSREKYREIPVVVQGRSFNDDGTLFYPDNRAFFEGLNVEGTAGTVNEQFPGAPELQIEFAGNNAQDKVSDIAPIWNPETFFNTMVVNGTTWPTHEVAPSLYRLRMLNGTNSRFLNLSLPVVDPATGLQTTVTRTQYYREVNSNTGDYTGPWKTSQVRTNELYAFQIGTEQSMLPQVVAVRTGFATRLLYNPDAWANETAPYFVENDYKITGETAAPDPAQALLLGPAERADILIDFRGLPDGTVIRMINTAPDAPFGGFPDVPADPDTTGQVMQFVVNSALLGASPTDEERSRRGQLLNEATAATSPWNLQLGLVDGGAPPPVNLVRELALMEEESALVCYVVDVAGNWVQTADIPVAGVCPGTALPFAPKAAVLGVVDAAGIPAATLWSDPIVTTVAAFDTEQWNLNNFTVDAHPIHVHLVKYQVTGRTNLDGTPSATVTTPDGRQAWENGWKDTVIAYPGETTSIAAEFDIPGLYVWHCHILEHEDNEMMVPFCVGDSVTNGGTCPDKLF